MPDAPTTEVRVSRLAIYQSLWAMEGLPGVDLDNDLDGALARILDAGFDGVGVNLARRPRAERAAEVLGERGLGWEAQAYVRTPEELSRYVKLATALGGAHHLTVQVAPGPVSLDEAVAAMTDLLDIACEAPLPVLFETHRGRLTNDLLLTDCLLDACPGLRLTGDLSHYVTAHELTLPPGPPFAPALGRVLRRCDALHLRVAGPNQVQVAIDAPQHALWRMQFLTWWSTAMDAWLARAAPDASFAVLCELGPPPYAITDGEGRELSDRWREALSLRDLARALFAEAQAGRASGA